MVWSVDRLGRSLQDLIGFLDEVHALNIDLYINQQGIDTTTPAGKAMFQMMGVFAEFERSMIRERQREGIKAAQEAGKQIGAKPKLDKPQIREIKRRIKKGEGKAALAREYGISRQTIYNALA